MDDMMQRLQAVLSDPESMKNLSELAAMLQEPDGQTEPPEPAAAPPFDLAKLMAVGQAMSRTQQDDTVALLAALKLHLRPERAKRAEQAIKMLRVYQIAGVLREQGLLADLLDG